MRLIYLHHNSDTLKKVKYYLSWVECQNKTKLRVIYIDNRYEYVICDLIMWCLDHGIQIQTTMPYTLEQNGIAEHYNWTVVELAWIMLVAYDVPPKLWLKAMSHVCYIHNCAYTHIRKNGMPYHIWTGHKPNISHIQEFESPVWILQEAPIPHKFKAKSYKHIFIGYEDGSQAIKGFTQLLLPTYLASWSNIHCLNWGRDSR